MQQTTFATGHRVTVNFGSTAHFLPDEARVEPLSFEAQRQTKFETASSGRLTLTLN